MDAASILQVIALGAGALGAGDGWRRWLKERDLHNKLKLRTQELLMRYKALAGTLDAKAYDLGEVNGDEGSQ